MTCLGVSSSLFGRVCVALKEKKVHLRPSEVPMFLRLMESNYYLVAVNHTVQTEIMDFTD